MTRKLHKTQKRLLEVLKTHETDPLTIRELQEELDLSSTSVVHHHIQQLEKKGYLRRNPSNPQDYQVLSDSPDQKITYLNMYGLAHCGPNGSVLDGDPVDRIPISTQILGFSSSEAFMVKAKGDSMEPRILDGDLVIARKSKFANDGEIVICRNNGEIMIKKLVNSLLVSLNQKYDPFLLGEDFEVQGIVRAVYSYRL